MADTKSRAKAHIVMPEEVLREIDRFVGKRKRSQFVAAAARKELQRLRLERALAEAAGAWKDEDHPELAKVGTERWVRDLRTLDESRTANKKKPGRS